MMYNSKLVASIKVSGKILREFKDSVYIPFGSEYSILLKNLNTVRALVNIYVDGENVTPNGLVLNAGQEVDFERSLANGSLLEGNKFKFIERTGNIEKHRGVKLEDGLIRVEFQFEKVYRRQDGFQINQVILGGHHPYNSGITWTSSNSALRSSGMTKDATRGMHPGVACSSADFSYTCDMADMVVGASLQSVNATASETGITVAGSKSEQKFTTVSNFACEPEKFNIVLKLLGETEDNKTIRNPITVKAKPKCSTCGKQNKATAKFCSECGTALVIYA